MSDIFKDFDKKNDFPKVSIDRIKIGGKELAEEVANNILNGKFELGIEKIAKDIVKRQDDAMAMEFTKCIGELLKKNGVVPKLTEYIAENHEENFLRSKYEMKYGVSIDELDFSEHDKVFEDKIEDLESLMQKRDEFLEMKNIQIAELKQRIAELKDKIGDRDEINRCLREQIAELESKGTERATKINLNDRIKVKLTPLGVEIYYHQYDELSKQIKERGGKQLEPRMPEIDKEGYTKFTLWNFMELYGEHIGMCKPNVIAPLYIELCQDK